MAVDGKNASGRLASATVFWLLVAIFANQDYVYCEGEEVQQEFNSRLQQQQQQQQQQQFQPPQQQQQQQQQPLTQQQQLQLPLPLPQMQLPQPQMQPPQSQMQLPQTQIPLQQLQQPPPNQQLNQQQQRPPNQQLNQQQQRPPNQQLEPLQELGKPSPTNMLNDLQLNLNKLSPGQLMNSDFGQGPIRQPQQSLSNVGVPANMPGGGRMPSYLDNPSQVLNYDETKLPQGANLPFHVNSPFDNNQQKYPEQNMQQKPMMQYLPNHYLSRPFMGQQIPRPYQPQLYFNNGNADNMYDVQASTGPSAGYPGQSYPNTNTGDQMGSAQTFNKMISTDPIELVQKPIGLFINSVDKLSRYGAGVKDALTRVFNEGMGKLFDESQSGAHKVYGYGLAGTDAALELGRRLLVSDPRSQQAGDSVGRYNSPLQQQNYNGFNPNQQTPTHAMGYAPAVQPNAQGAVPQIDYSQQRPGTNYLQGANGGNPINAPQPIFRYGPN